MGFLKLETSSTTNKYEKFGYLENPFPIRGKVAVEIYVERPELQGLKDELTTFLQQEGRGGFWALEAERGVGKSNFLQHLKWELLQAQERGVLSPKIICEYVPGGFIGARVIVERLIIVVGEERFRTLLEKRINLPDSLKGTDLWRFFGSSPVQQRNLDIENPNAYFLMKWIMGHFTTAEERKKYGIWSKDRVPPAVAFPYLKVILTKMREEGIIDKVLLLMDEFEDVQQLENKNRTEFIQTLKNMLNSFNWDMLFVILAGQAGAFTTIGSQYTSLADRWRLVGLKSIETSAQAVKFARVYMQYAHETFCRKKGENEQKVENLKPNEQDIKVVYSDLSKTVTQRDFLDKLYDWIESKLGN